MSASYPSVSFYFVFLFPPLILVSFRPSLCSMFYWSGFILGQQEVSFSCTASSNFGKNNPNQWRLHCSSNLARITPASPPGRKKCPLTVFRSVRKIAECLDLSPHGTTRLIAIHISVLTYVHTRTRAHRRYKVVLIILQQVRVRNSLGTTYSYTYDLTFSYCHICVFFKTVVSSTYVDMVSMYVFCHKCIFGPTEVMLLDLTMFLSCLKFSCHLPKNRRTLTALSLLLLFQPLTVI